MTLQVLYIEAVNEHEFRCIHFCVVLHTYINSVVKSVVLHTYICIYTYRVYFVVDFVIPFVDWLAFGFCLSGESFTVDLTHSAFLLCLKA